MLGICKSCGAEIEYEEEDVGIGVRIKHGFCENKNCPTYGWATNNIISIEKEEEDTSMDNTDCELNTVCWFDNGLERTIGILKEIQSMNGRKYYLDDKGYFYSKCIPVNPNEIKFAESKPDQILDILDEILSDSSQIIIEGHYAINARNTYGTGKSLLEALRNWKEKYTKNIQDKDWRDAHGYDFIPTKNIDQF